MFKGPFTYERVPGGIEDYDYFSIRDANGKLVASCGDSEESAKFIVRLMNRGLEDDQYRAKFEGLDRE